MSVSELINISDSDEEDQVLNDIRTVNDRYQERLLAAQHDALDKQIEAALEKSKKANDEDSIDMVKEIQHFERMIQKTQSEVMALEEELEKWQQKQVTDASISSLTPEERARRVELEQNEISGEPRTVEGPLEVTMADVDSIFAYLFQLGAEPQGNAAEFENTTTPRLMEPNRQMKEKVLAHPEIIRQQKFTHLTFTKMDNGFIEYDDGEYRKCELVGKAYDTPFSVTFRVSPSLKLRDLDFEVPMALKVDGKPLLSRIKDEDNLHLFFRLIQHYGRLEYDKQRSFEYLMKYYKDTDVRISNEDPHYLVFDTRWDDLQLNLTWSYKSTENIQYEKLDVNICEQLIPQVRLSVISEWRSTQFDVVMNQVPEKFESMAATQGVLSATKMMVGMILQKPHDDKRQRL